MMKPNLMIKTAIASALVVLSVGAHAAIANPTGVIYASENFGTGSDASVLTAIGALNPVYTMGVARTVAGGTFQFKVTLTNAVFAVAPTGASLTVGTSGAATTSVRSGGAVGDTTVTFDVTPTTSLDTTSTLTFVVPNLKSASALGTVGAKIQATVALSDLFGAFDTSGAHTADLAVSAASMTAAIVATTATGTAPLSGTIDAISQASKFFTTTPVTPGSNTVSLGSVTFANVTGPQVAVDSATDRTTKPGDAIAVTLTGNFGAALGTLPALSGVYLSTSAATCTAVAAINATTLTATTATFAAVPGNTANVGICMKVDGTTAIAPFTPTAVASYTPAAVTEKALTVASTALLPLALNVTQQDVRNYIPAAVTGYIQTVRLINTGSTAAQFNVALVDEATGVVSPTVNVGGNVPVNGSLRLSQAQIEAAIGAQAGSVRPRLRFSAATSAFEVQSFFNNANGAYTNLSGKE